MRINDLRREHDELCWKIQVAAVSRGLFVRHDKDSRRLERGWPDLEIVGTRIIYREVKTRGGRPSPAQERIGDLLIMAGGDWAVWRDIDYQSGRIAYELDDISIFGSGTASI